MIDSPQFKLGPLPDVFVQDFQPHTARVHLVQLSEAEYRTASFLDQRVLTGTTAAKWVEWEDVAVASHAMPALPGPDFIFHIGHVGSTLVSRILGDHPRVFALREPPWLRTMADALVLDPQRATLPPHLTPHIVAQALNRLTARTFRPEQRAQVKVTSFASELAPYLIPHSPQSRVIGLVAAPQVHMATLLAGQNNMIEVNAMGPSRLIRLKRRIPGLELTWPTLSTGERLAATWVSEMASLSAALSAAGSGALAIDFDDLLRDPQAALESILQHLHGAADPVSARSLATSTHFTKYSKAQNFEYSPSLRAQLLSEAWRTNAPELKSGLNWLQKLIAAHLPLARLLGPFMGN